MNENEVNRIANAVNALRPDWPAASLRTLISGKLGNRTRRDVAVALTWVACDSTTKTPARVLEAGPWWHAVMPEGGIVRHPPKRGDDCPGHPGEWPDSCRGCASDRLAGTETRANPRRTPVDPDALAATRAALATAKAALCSHGIAHNVCKEKHDG